MFTGIINHLGTVKKRTATALVISAKIPKPKLGASIAVNGTCLTVVKTKGGEHSFDVGPDTWKRTNLGALRPGQQVNVEPSLKLGQEIGGHFVSGHVDATGEIVSLEPWGQDFYRLRVELPKALTGLVAVKGSIAIDGISLTVTAVNAEDFEVMLVPHTLRHTNLGKRGTDDRVNLEVDPLARYAMTAASALRSKK
ncbi:MAG: riboflavin synthase [Elusimicrobia bacterium]|nr:riboflavin synthase [Elusimicrobiota bacterium]